MVQFCGREVLIEKEFSNRGMRLGVNIDGRVVVKIGYRSTYTEAEIQDFVNKHKRFLRNRLSRHSGVQLPDFIDGGKVTLLGKEYTVVKVDGASSFAIKGNTLYVPNNFSRCESERFFGGLLLPHVKALTESYAKKYGLTYSYVGLHAWQSAWGTHFGEDNSIKYNVALVFVEKECIEYVVAHELCHTLYSNHSAAFWAAVERIYPRYKEDRVRLKDYSIQWIFEKAKLGKSR
ncbi:MAG: M48 family metallopeptidase [Clostridia bacterium]|nr:M48 family metallopeptidase [Clostridia bacterium]